MREIISEACGVNALRCYRHFFRHRLKLTLAKLTPTPQRVPPKEGDLPVG